MRTVLTLWIISGTGTHCTALLINKCGDFFWANCAACIGRFLWKKLTLQYKYAALLTFYNLLSSLRYEPILLYLIFSCELNSTHDSIRVWSLGAISNYTVQKPD